MIQNLRFGILFWKKLFLAYNFFPVDIIRVFFNCRFSCRKSQSQQKLVKKSLVLQYSFAQKASLILWTLTHLILKVTCSCKTAKSLSNFTNFPANMFLFGVGKNIGTKLFPDAQELHSWTNLKANVCIFLYISAGRFLFQIRSKILSGGD